MGLKKKYISFMKRNFFLYWVIPFSLPNLLTHTLFCKVVVKQECCRRQFQLNQIWYCYLPGNKNSTNYN